jgi:hypothetical protein
MAEQFISHLIIIVVLSLAIHGSIFSLATSIRRYTLGKLICPFLEANMIRSLMIPLRISGEMLLFARKIRVA